MSIILAHPKAPVIFDPPVTAESVAFAKEIAAVERVIAAQQDEEGERLQAVEDLIVLCERWGYKRVIRWATNAGREAGQV